MAEQKFFDRLFPVKYNFYEMLGNQARMNLSGVEALCKWISEGSEKEAESLLQDVISADIIRMDLEKNLIQSFSTPFDRGDIYSISVGMDKVIEYAKSTLLSMKAYDVRANQTIINMLENLKTGTAIFAESIEYLEKNPSKAELNISGIREAHDIIEQLYREGMEAVFKSNDPIAALKQREVYHHIKDASANLDEAVDILHRIVVRLT